jgi:hypothetical protein
MKKFILPVVLTGILLLSSAGRICADNKVIVGQKHWEYVETGHFKIYYYPQCKELLPVLSDILEDAFNSTTRFYEYRPAKKIPFFIYGNHNEFEQTNITDVGEGTGGVTEALKNRFLVFNDGSVRWLKTVIPHEFTHEIQFTVLYEESPLVKALRLARGIFIPLWMMEGMAEYNTGNTDATTREMMIRDMVASKSVIELENLNSFNHLKPHQITPAYKLSETAIRFLVDEYGENKPQEMLKVLRDKLDTTIAFADSVHMTPDLFEKKWLEWIYEEYRDKVTGFREADSYGRKLTSDNGDNVPDFNTDPAISPSGKEIAYISDEDGDNKLVIMNLESGVRKTVARSNTYEIDLIHNCRMSFSSDGTRLAFCGEKMQRDYVYIYDFRSSGISRLPIDVYAVDSPCFSPVGGKIIFSGMKTVFNDIYEYDFNSGALTNLTSDQQNQTDPVCSPDGHTIAFSQEDTASGRSDIYLFDMKDKTRKRITELSGQATGPSFSPDGTRVAFSADSAPGEPVNIYTVSMDGTGLKKETSLLTGAFTPSFSPDGKNLVFTCYRDFRKEIYMAPVAALDGSPGWQETGQDVAQPVSSAPVHFAGQVKPYRFKPSLDIIIPFVLYHSEYGLFLATYWQGSELFGDHEIANQIVYQSSNGDLQYTLNYNYKKWRPQFSFSMSGTNSEYLSEFEETYREKQLQQAFAVSYPLDRFNSIGTVFSTKKYVERNVTSGLMVADERRNVCAISYERNTETGKYLYLRYGSAATLLFRRAVRELGGDIDYREYVGRYEKFFPVASQSALVVGGLAVASEGQDRRFFRLPLRGFSHNSDDYRFNRLAAISVEYRFPLFTLESVWPTADFFAKSLNCFFYTDSGAGFNSRQEFRALTARDVGNSVGAGVRLYTFLAGYLLPVTIDYAKKTNDSTGRWNFTLGVSLPY